MEKELENKFVEEPKTKKKEKEVVKREKELNIYQKLVRARAKFIETKIEKTGNNTFAKYKYFQLDDFIPTIDKLNLEFGLITLFNLNNDMASLKVINVDNPTETIEFNVPSESVEIKGATKIQNLGGEITYLKRYLYQNAYEITEPDLVEGVAENNKALQEAKAYKPKASKTREDLLKEANDLHINLENTMRFFKVNSVDELSDEQILTSITNFKKYIENKKKQEEQQNNG